MLSFATPDRTLTLSAVTSSSSSSKLEAFDSTEETMKGSVRPLGQNR